jgi:hypothetical protein
MAYAVATYSEYPLNFGVALACAMQARKETHTLALEL